MSCTYTVEVDTSVVVVVARAAAVVVVVVDSVVGIVVATKLGK